MIHVITPGLLTTVQDEGRWGAQAQGVPVAGPMDRVSHRLANQLVGNPEACATLEVTLVGPEIEFERPAVFAVTGATFLLELDGRPVPMETRIRARSKSCLRFGPRRHGARAYLAVAGGFDVPVVLGSRSTHTGSRMGGVEGRALAAGDHIRIGSSTTGPGARSSLHAGRIPAGGARVRVLPGPHDAWFSDAARAMFCSTRYRVASASNRMGYRLDGPRLDPADRGTLISEATPVGSVQVPSSGQPIVLMADCQTTGGYPRIATVITTDLPLVGQLAPGDWIEFTLCDRKTALAALIAQERGLMHV